MLRLYYKSLCKKQAKDSKKAVFFEISRYYFKKYIAKKLHECIESRKSK